MAAVSHTQGSLEPEWSGAAADTQDKTFYV